MYWRTNWNVRSIFQNFYYVFPPNFYGCPLFPWIQVFDTPLLCPRWRGLRKGRKDFAFSRISLGCPIYNVGTVYLVYLDTYFCIFLGVKLPIYGLLQVISWHLLNWKFIKYSTERLIIILFHTLFYVIVFIINTVSYYKEYLFG